MHTTIVLTSTTPRRHGLRAGIAIALIALAVAGCASTSDRNAAPSAPAPEAAPVATNTAPAAAEPAAEPAAAPAQVDPGGKELAVIWTRPPSDQQQHEHGAPSAEAFYATRVSLNDTWLAVDVKSESRISNSPWRGKFVQPEVRLLVDGCPAKAPGLRPVSLGYGGSEGRLMMQRGDLPKGDLDFTFKAFGKEHTMLFANDEKGLRTITELEQKNVRVRPADPAKGLPEMVTVLPSKCDAVESAP